ncbi:MAG: hypothetical protein Fur0021_39840 [Candidatus Promineifilaceae bacterium]
MQLKQLKKLTWRVAVGFLICLGAGVTWAQDTDPVVAPLPVLVRVQPAAIEVAAGGQVDVAVEVTDVTDLFGFDITLTFDPTVVQVVDMNPATPDRTEVALGAFLEPGFEVRNQVDNALGTLQYVMTQVNPSPSKSGSGVLLVVRFQGIQAGAASPVQLTSVVLGQPRGVVFPADTTGGDGLITVVTETTAVGTPIPFQFGTRPDLDVTLTAMAGQPAATVTPARDLLPTPTASPSANGLQTVSLTVIGCLIFLLLVVLAYLLWRLRRKSTSS